MSEMLEIFKSEKGKHISDGFETIDSERVKKCSLRRDDNYVDVEMDDGENFIVKSSEVYKINRLNE
jgi:hypothetical protein